MNDLTTVRIRQRAYELFLQRGGTPGDDLRDWLNAEQEVREQQRAHHGPARLADSARCGKVTHPDGCDIENPT